MISPRWRAALTRSVDRFEHDPAFQVRFHLYAMIFWIINAAAGTALMFIRPDVWITVGVYYVFILSIYANWATDYDAVSAASAFLHAKRADEKNEP